MAAKPMLYQFSISSTGFRSFQEFRENALELAILRPKRMLCSCSMTIMRMFPETSDCIARLGGGRRIIVLLTLLCQYWL